MAFGEAVVFFNPVLAEDFDYRCKQAGQLASKMRFLAAPWIGILETGAWLRNARHANACARQLANQIVGLRTIRLLFPLGSNAVFLQMSDEQATLLRDRGWRFYTSIGGGARLMFSWDTDADLVRPKRSTCLPSVHKGPEGV